MATQKHHGYTSSEESIPHLDHSHCSIPTPLYRPVGEGVYVCVWGGGGGAASGSENRRYKGRGEKKKSWREIDLFGDGDMASDTTLHSPPPPIGQ